MPFKIILKLLYLTVRYIGIYIKNEVVNIINFYGIVNKVGYFILNNAKNNDLIIEFISKKLKFVRSTRHTKYVRYTLNFATKTLFFGYDINTFKKSLKKINSLTVNKYDL